MHPDERKARQLVGQFLTRPGTLTAVASGLCGLQAQFLSHALLGLRLRAADFSPAAAEAALVKSWTLRGTVHIFPREDLPLYLDPESYHSHDWTRPDFWNSRPDWALTPRRQDYFSRLILDSLSDGPLPRERLKELCRARGLTEAEEGSLFHPWGGGLRQLCQRGFLHYAVREEKLLCLTPPLTPLPREEARRELARRYFTHFGPATVHDAMYFFRATARQVSGWMAELPLQELRCQDRTCYLIDSGLAPAPLPRCLFLPCFDQLLLGYEKRESLYLPPERLRQVFSLSGIVSAVVLLDGEVAAHWQRKGRALLLQPFRNLTPEERTLLSREAERLWPEGRLKLAE